ncbi:MAG: adenylosuccinate synthetase, partial [Candidatus Acidoferrales bacterium]
AEVLQCVQAEYVVRPGWQAPTRGLAAYKELPERARDYLKFVADQVGVEIGMVSTGPQRQETILPPDSRLAPLVVS